MLEVAHVTRRFGEHVAVDDVSFAVAPGALTGFVGGNGAGKTTTMRMIMGVLAVQSGEMRWDGRPVTELDRRSFGYMPEERGLYPKQPVLDQLVYLARLRGLPADKARHAPKACWSGSLWARAARTSSNRCRWAISSACRSRRR
jgi:ABC-2 type transport system ATP-binding protein